MPYIANRVREGEEGVFSLLQGWIAEAQKAGKEIINLGIGSPNRCPEGPILEAVWGTFWSFPGP
jgi:aspartate/methionine/tyrosine aminotransferase